MPTPKKTSKIIKIEGVSHRTKAEIRQREEAENATLTNEKIKERPEVRNNKKAHSEFLRVRKLLKIIEKNDALYEPVINRYCMLQAECEELAERRRFFEETMKDMKRTAKETELEGEEKADFLLRLTRELSKIAAQINACDKLLSSKRKMLFDIEKENIMTIAAALRTVPTKTEKKKNPLLEALGNY